MNPLERGAAACSQCLYRLACMAVLPLLTLLLIADIASRTLRETTLPWATESSGLLLLCLLFLALPHLVHQRLLLRIDLLHLPTSFTAHPIAGRLLALLPPLMLMLFSLLFVAQSTTGLRDTLRYGDRTFSLPLPLWPFYGLMLASSVLMLIHALLQLVRAAQAGTTP